MTSQRYGMSMLPLAFSFSRVASGMPAPASTWFKLQGRAISNWYLIRARESYALVVISKSTFPIPRDGSSEHNIIPPVLPDETPASRLRERPYEGQEPGPSDFNPHMELSSILVAF